MNAAQVLYYLFSAGIIVLLLASIPFSLWLSRRNGDSNQSVATQRRYLLIGTAGFVALLLGAGVFLSESPLIARIGRLLFVAMTCLAGCLQIVFILRAVRLRAVAERSRSQSGFRAWRPVPVPEGTALKVLISALFFLLAWTVVTFHMNIAKGLALFNGIAFLYTLTPNTRKRVDDSEQRS